MKAIYIALLAAIVACNPIPTPIHKDESEEKVQTIKTEESYYTCSMHPQIHEAHPGKCPICGMQLVKVIRNSADSESPKENNVIAQVRLKKSQVSHFKADVFTVTTMNMQKKIRLLGTVMKSEDRESNIPARVAGRVEQVMVESTGSLIRKGDPVLKLYSPQLLTGGDEYLIARKNYMANKKNKKFAELYKQSKERMNLWGVLNSQLEQWGKVGKVPRQITIYSPVTGIVEKKNAIVGKYFKEGQSFFDLVDLSSLWVEMDVYELDSALVGLGQDVALEFNAYPGEIWHTKLDFINPVLSEKTRTLKVRATLKNKEGKLRPGMAGVAFVTLALKGRPLVIPRTAIIDTGKRKVVWLDIGNHHYEAHIVHTGFESEGYVEVKEGLVEGENVVIDGNFLLDAQAQLFGGYSLKSKSSTTHSGHHH